MHTLKSKWNVYYHAFSDTWTIESYTKLCCIETIEDYWKFMNNIPDISNGMFFIMRGDILPIWEDTLNKNGGAWTLFISNNQVNSYLINITAFLVNEQLIKNPDMAEEINGISITPKHRSFSIKIWNKSHRNHSKIKFNEDVNLFALNYKQHK